MTVLRGARTRSLLPLGPAVALPVTGYLLFTSTGRDDAYITYWAARSLARTGRITNYNGARLEQSSSLLQTLLLAAGNRMTTLSVPTLGIWLGIAAAVLTVLLAARVAERIQPGAGIIAAALTAVAPFLVYWAFGGLETPIVAVLLLLTLLAAADAAAAPTPRTLALLGLATVAFVLVRPEGGLVLGCVAAAALVLGLTRLPGVPLGDGRWRGPLVFLVIDVVASLLLVGFREWYFGHAVPQPVRAKVGGVRIGDGLHYLRLWWAHWWMLPILVLAVAGVVVVVRRRSWTTVMLVLLLVGYGGFVVMTGGDWMEAGRFLVPVAPLVAILAAVAVRRIPSVLWQSTAVVVVVATQVLGLGWVASRWSTGHPAWGRVTSNLPAADVAVVAGRPWYERGNRVHYRDAVFVVQLERVVDALAAKEPVVTVTSGQAGMVPYYLFAHRPHGVRFIDTGSLTSDAFARCSHALVKSSLGAAMTLGYWLAHTGECGVPAPDVVYQLGPFSAQPVLARGYRLVYQQPEAAIRPDTSFLRGPVVSAAEFIAVRADLLPLPVAP